MPKLVAFSLAWSNEQQRYILCAMPGNTVLDILPESGAWFDWLGQVSAFIFSSKTTKQYTLRKESRQRGDVYWYAYQGSGKQLSKKYVGKTENLTLAHLEAIAATLSTYDSASIVADEEPAKPAPPADILTHKSRQSPLLATKLRVPRVRAQLVERAHLLPRPDQGLLCPLTLISASAGFGKTTLLAQWLAQHKTAAAWVSLEPEDNQLTRFLSYVIAALQKLDTEIGSTSLPALQSPQTPAIEVILSLLTNEIADSAVDPLLLVLDDYHVITAEAIHTAMSFLIEHLPPQLHLVILTRSDPPFALSRLRARGQLTELRTADLRFNNAEASTFLRDVMHSDLSAQDVGLLEQRTEGWVAGLQLAALSLRGQQDSTAFLQAFSGSHRFVLDYLSDEVLAHQPEPVLTFLLHTCILERLSGPLCAAMLGEEMGLAEHHSQAMLESLENANLFINALDDEQQWYRYHRLFATVLQARLAHNSPTLIPLLHQRASHWFEQHGYIHEAIHHALVIQDAARVAALLQPIGWDTLLQGNFDVLLGWLQRLPIALERTQPLLCLYHAAALAFLGQSAAAEVYLKHIEQFTQTENAPLVIPAGELAAVRMVIAVTTGDQALAVEAGQHARTQLAQEQIFLRGMVVGSEAFVHAVNGDFRAAIQMLWEANTISPPTDNIFTEHRGKSAFAFFLLHLGQLRQTIAVSGEILRLANRPAGRPLPFLGSLCVVRGIALYEQNNLTAASQIVLQGIDLCEQMGEQHFLSAAYALLAQIRYREQQLVEPQAAPANEVLELMQKAETLLWAQPPVLLWTRNYSAYFLVRLWLMQHNMEAILRLEQFYPIDEQACLAPGAGYAAQTEAWALAYIRLAQHQPERTVALLHWPIEAAENAGRIHHMLRMLILQALAYHALGQIMEAISSIQKALSIGETEGYINPFVEMGLPMAELLLTFLAQVQIESATTRTIQQYAQGLLLELGVAWEAPAQQPSSGQIAPSSNEKLTEREMAILRLMGTGLSNQEIAQQLIVEESTVKWHINHIYSKLHVKNRAQAILGAQAAGLL